VALQGLCHGAAEVLHPVLNVSLPVEDLDEVEVAVVGLLQLVVGELVEWRDHHTLGESMVRKLRIYISCMFPGKIRLGFFAFPRNKITLLIALF
jgi:hypothetical protein